MRKFVKTVAVLALAVSVLSTSAFAALTGANGTYSATVTPNVSGEQVTLLAVDKTAVNLEGLEPVLSNVTDGDIYYIDQNDTGVFTNFQVKDGYVGQELFFFAGTASSNNAIYLGNAENLASITIAAPSYDGAIEVEGTVALSMSYDDGARLSAADVTWVATKDGNAVEGVLSATSAEGATFTGAEAGTYVITAAAKGVTSNAVTIEVVEPDTSVKAEVAQTVTTTPGENGAEAQNGFGVSLAITNWSADFTDMIWVFVTDNNRYYSEKVAISTLAGIGEGSQVTINAAFANGSNNEAALVIDDVEAIFRDGTGAEYFTDPANDDVADRRAPAAQE